MKTKKKVVTFMEFLKRKQGKPKKDVNEKLWIREK